MTLRWNIIKMRAESGDSENRPKYDSRLDKKKIKRYFHGGCAWVRTRDQLIKSQLLYRLSYASVKEVKYGTRGGI